MTKADTSLKSPSLIGPRQSRDPGLRCHMSAVYSYHGNASPPPGMLCLYDGIFALISRSKKATQCQEIKGCLIYFSGLVLSAVTSGHGEIMADNTSPLVGRMLGLYGGIFALISQYKESAGCQGDQRIHISLSRVGLARH